MDKFVIVINNYKLYVFEMNGRTSAELFHIRGNDYDELDLDDPEYSTERIKNYLLDTLNYNDFSNCSFNVIYNDVQNSVLHALMVSFTSARDFEVNKLENSLVSILLKLEKINVGQRKVIKFHDTSWEVKLSEDGILEVLKTNDEHNIQLTVKDIPAALFSDYSFSKDKKELDRLSEKANFLNEELENTKKELHEISENYPKLKVQRMEESKLEKRGGIIYIEGQENPFTGYKITYYENNKIVKLDVPYKDGKKHGQQVSYNNEGFINGITYYINGKELNSWKINLVKNKTKASKEEKIKSVSEFCNLNKKVSGILLDKSNWDPFVVSRMLKDITDYEMQKMVNSILYNNDGYPVKDREEIIHSTIDELSQVTGRHTRVCKKALVQANYDYNEAIILLKSLNYS